MKDLIDPVKKWVAVFKSEAESRLDLKGERPIPSQMGLVVKDIERPEEAAHPRRKAVAGE